jgi:hypothetical protein
MLLADAGDSSSDDEGEQHGLRRIAANADEDYRGGHGSDGDEAGGGRCALTSPFALP